MEKAAANPSTLPRTTGTKNPKSRVALLHSDSYTQVRHHAMQYIHQDRDVLLAALLHYCGFVRQTPKFFSVVKPKKATRQHMERFHKGHYLDVLEPPAGDEDNWRPSSSLPEETKLLDSLGLTEDCALPTCPRARHVLWDYCRYVVGASLQAADLLVTDEADVAINWGGGRHHAHQGSASGFCFVNDVVLAIQHLQERYHRTLYLDIDIHHADGVQNAFYDTDSVMTVSLHRYSRGFFPASTGSLREKGLHDTPGIGYNLNIPLPKSTGDADFCHLFRYALENLLEAYDPEVVVLCVGADGLKGDPLVGEADGWNLSPEGLAECVRFASMVCSGETAEEETLQAEIQRDPEMKENRSMNGPSTDKRFRERRKLLVLGGGGYNPPQTARTFLLSTAAACEGARPGMLSKELPCDIPRHDYFPRYGPEFVLFSQNWSLSDESTHHKYMNSDYESVLKEARKEVDLTALYLQGQRKKEAAVPAFGFLDVHDEVIPSLGQSKFPRKRRRKKKNQASQKS